jgi:Protein of unknown function (DUF3833)
MKHSLKVFTMTLLSSLWLFGCGSNEPKPDYTDTKHTFNITDFFAQKASGSGVFFDYSDKADRHFYVTFSGDKKGKDFYLTEDFTWSDGEKQQRIWHLVFQDDKNFTGTAADVVGVAKGKLLNNGLHMLYTLRVKRSNGSEIDLNMDDRMYLTEDNRLINRAKAKKFGITVGELVASFSRDTEQK